MKKLLIVVDFQNDFVCGALGFPNAAALDEKICQKIDEYKNDEIVYTLDTHDENYLSTQEGRLLPISHCIKGSAGHELYGKAKEKLAGTRFFEKSTFASLELGEYLKNKRYSSIELVGLVSNICVLSNAVIARAACPETEIIVDGNLTSSSDRELHAKALDVMRGLQITVL